MTNTIDTTLLDLGSRIRDAAVVNEPYMLANGAQLQSYLDGYRIASDPSLLSDVCQAMASCLPKDAVAVAGIAMGGVPLAVGISLLVGVEGLFIRKLPKPYGRFSRVEGVLKRSGGVVAIEDVIRSGTQMLAAITALRASGLRVVGASCVLERRGPGRSVLKGAGVPLMALFSEETLSVRS